jgi:hypothetical protein
MTAIDFASAFESLTGHAPFRWQERLFDDHSKIAAGIMHV